MNKSGNPSQLALITVMDASSVIMDNTVVHIKRSFTNEYSDSHLVYNVYISGTDISVDTQKVKDLLPSLERL